MDDSKRKHADLVTFSVTILTVQGDERKYRCKNVIKRFYTDETWFDVYCDLTSDEISKEIDKKFEKIAKIEVSTSPTDTVKFNADPYDEISVLSEFDRALKHVTITLKNENPSNESTECNTSQTKSAFDILMQAPKKKPTKISVDKPRFTAKDKLFNDIVDDLDTSMLFPSTLPQDEIKRRVMVLVDTIWYIDGSHEKINTRLPTGKKIPSRFTKYVGYNDFKAKRKAAPQLTSKDLVRHAELLFRMVSSNYAKSWGKTIGEVEDLAMCLQSYADYLEDSNKKQMFRQSLSQPARQCGDSASVQYVPKCHGPIKACYSKLDQILSEAEYYTPIYFDEAIHVSDPFTNYSQRHRFLQELSLSTPVDTLRYDPGAGMGQTIFIWRVPDDRSQNEIMSSATKVFKSLENKLPQYHTREMRREFSRTYRNLVDIPPHIMRAIYSDLTMDASVCQNHMIESRLRKALLTEDTEMAIDLRSLNKGKPDDTFTIFFEQLEKEVESVTAADERRHSDVQHFSQYISVRDLIERTTANCPAGTPIPSESTVLFAFVPRNAYTNTAKLYKGRINLQHKVQSRQLRSSHIDEHYCAAIFSYLKHYAVKYRDSVSFVCLDDKSKIDYGEPGLALSTGVRGKKSLVPVSATLGALDHDVGSKGSLTPSVCLEVDVPEEVSDSFYRGQVHVTLKDSVFQPSSPFRHGVELLNVLKNNPKSYLLLYTDGGPDHRTTYGAVKLSLILLFKQLNLDILIAARTAPGNSWANPAERIMSLLNLAYQNVSLYRTEMSSHFEHVLKSCGGMNDIRKRSEKEDHLEEAWLKSISGMVSLLNERTQRVQLKGKKFICPTPASKQEVIESESKVRQWVDPDITIGKYTKIDLKKCEDYKEYINRHCQERNYIFQVRKCNVSTCCVPVQNPTGVVPPFLPDPEVDPGNRDHFKRFDDIIGTQTNESDMPSGQTVSAAKVAEEKQGCPNKNLVAQNVRSKVECEECGKPRCLYSKKSLTVREERYIKRLLEKFSYTCGSVITPDAGDSLQGLIFVRLQLSCSTPVEMAYYSATSIGKKDICCYCASDEETERDADSLQTYRVVLPMCKTCRDKPMPVIRRLPKKN